MLDAPIILKPKMVPRIWGGARISELFSRPACQQPIGESWEIHGQLEVQEGPLAGRTLDQLVVEFGSELLGRRNQDTQDFPLLTKWLDCNDWLSVQVHPDDPLARELTGDPTARGKSEAWYVVDSNQDSRLIHGVNNGVDPNSLAGLEPKELLERLAQRTPQAGELLFTPAGTIHALGPGALIYEVQQSSDLTYRFYDWGRDRPVHPEKARRCAVEATSPPHEQRGNEGVTCAYFSIEVARQECRVQLNGESFRLVAAVEGGAKLSGDFSSLHLAAGSSALLPSGLGEVLVEPQGATLLIDVPESDS